MAYNCREKVLYERNRVSHNSDSDVEENHTNTSIFIERTNMN